MKPDTAPSRFRFSALLTEADRGVLMRVGQWRWIASRGPFAAEGVRHPKHERWMKTPGNVYTPAHREVMLTFRGNAVHSLNERVHARQPGTVMLFDGHESRDLKGADHKKGFHCLWLHFSGRDYLTYNSNSCDARGRYFQEIPPGIKSGAQVELVMDAWDACYASDGTPADPLCWELLKAQLIAILLEVIGRNPAPPSPNQHQQVVAHLERHIRRHLADDLSLHALSRIAGYSPFFLHRLFVRHTGKTPVAYINDLRLELAGKLLCEGYTVQATAERVGFESASYFHHFFKRRMKRSPGEWRLREAQKGRR